MIKEAHTKTIFLGNYMRNFPPHTPLTRSHGHATRILLNKVFGSRAILKKRRHSTVTLGKSETS